MDLDLSRIKAFCLLRTSRTLHEAQKKSGVNLSTLRKRVLNLEEDLGVKLIDTAEHKLSITDVGQKFYPIALEILNHSQSRIDSFRSLLNKESDSITIATTQSIASLWVSPAINEFMEIFPNTRIVIKASDERIDLYQLESDAAIIPLEDDERKENMCYLPLVDFQMNLFASEDYVKKHGVPKKIEDLENHVLIAFGSGIPLPTKSIDWYLSYLPKDIKPRIQLNSGNQIFKMVEAGIGIGSVSQKGVNVSQKNLIPILPKLKGPLTKVFFAYPKSRSNETDLIKLYKLLKPHFA